MRRWVALSLLISTVLSAMGCSTRDICNQPTLVTQPAVLDGEHVVFEVRVLDESGAPVTGVEVDMTPLFRFPSVSGRGSGVPLAEGTTGDDGVTRGSVAIARLQEEGSATGLLQPAWVAGFQPSGKVGGELYCTTEADGGIPQEIVDQVNSGIDTSAFQTDDASSSDAGASDPIVPTEVEEQLENPKQPTIPPPQGNPPDLDET